jgi:hypothetical protein
MTNPLQNPSIEIFGLRIDEPVTMSTDIIVALISIIGYFKIASKNNSAHVKLYSHFFLWMGFSTLIAGIMGHGFLYRFGLHGKMYGWVLGIIGTGFSQFAVVYHVKENLNKTVFSALIFLCWIEVVAAMIILFKVETFVVVEVHAAFGLVGMVTILEAFNYFKTKSKLSSNMIIGVSFTVLAIIIHSAKIGISKWFNHMDISHVFLGIAVCIMIKGVLLEQKLNLKTV